jgi:hypothetical protein
MDQQPTDRTDGDRKLANRYGEIRVALGYFAPNPLVTVNRELRTALIAEAREIRAKLEAKGWTFNHPYPVD